MSISVSCHVSNGGNALRTSASVCQSEKHNLRKYSNNEKYNASDIEIIVGSEHLYQDVKRMYKQEFKEALDEFNQKQTRADRKINDYMKQVSEGKADVAVEIILQIGDKESWDGKDKKLGREPLLELLNTLQEEMPDFKIANATMHFDESVPHMHVVGVPVGTDYERGMRKQVAKRKVFTQASLQSLQKTMHETAEKCLTTYPVFNNETLKMSEDGRNLDVSKEFFIRAKEQDFKAMAEQLEDARKKYLDAVELLKKAQEDAEYWKGASDKYFTDYQTNRNLCAESSKELVDGRKELERINHSLDDKKANMDELERQTMEMVEKYNKIMRLTKIAQQEYTRLTDKQKAENRLWQEDFDNLTDAICKAVPAELIDKIKDSLPDDTYQMFERRKPNQW